MLESLTEGREIRRDRLFGIGKRVGGNVYVHKDYERVLPPRVQEAKRLLPDGFRYTIVKYNPKTSDVSFIFSPDFDTSHEPSLGDSVKVRGDNRVTRRKGLNDPNIYHHKWTMVGDDYAGFDVDESKERTLKWKSLEDVDTRRIGIRSYWDKNVVPRIR